MTNQEAPVFENIYKDYLKQVEDIDLIDKAEKLGICVNSNGIEIPFYNKKFIITPNAVSDTNGSKPHHAVCVILCKYLLLAPENPFKDDELVAYRNFKDASPYVGGFKNTAEMPIAKHFSGKLEELDQKCKQLGGKVYSTDVNTELAYEFYALPNVPVYLFFNDADEEFPADCFILFKKSAQQYLDMECIAMTGGILAQWLTMQK